MSTTVNFLDDLAEQNVEMMKILLLSPYIDAQHKVVRELEAAGVGVLLPQNAQEAWQILQLHGKSIDLAIVNRESRFGEDNEEGFEFVQRMKADPTQADLPLMITSAKWGDSEFARHQTSPLGANAYLRWPFDAQQLKHVIGAIFGVTLGAPAAPSSSPGASVSPPLMSTHDEQPVPDLEASHSEIILEEASYAPDTPSYRAPEGHISFEAHPDEGPAVAGLAIPSLEEPPAAQDAPLELAPPEASLSSLSLPAMEFSLTGSSSNVSEDGEIQLSAPQDEAPQAIELSPASEVSALEPVAPAEPMPEPELSGPEATVPEQSPEQPADEDQKLADEMPYLFDQKRLDPSMVFAQPIGDAVVPGGAAQSPDVETLKKYLLLREQDVAVLSAQLATTKEQVSSLDKALKDEKSRSVELAHVAAEYQRKISELETQHMVALESLQTESTELRFQVKAKSDKARVLELQVREATDEIERLKERVRADIRKIRVREKELENRLEIMKKDSEALIGARENKIVELKRKVDLLEFNMDLLQDQFARERDNSAKLRERLTKAAKVVRVAGGLLDSEKEGQAAELPGETDAADREAS